MCQSRATQLGDEIATSEDWPWARNDNVSILDKLAQDIKRKVKDDGTTSILCHDMKTLRKDKPAAALVALCKKVVQATDEVQKAKDHLRCSGN